MVMIAPMGGSNPNMWYIMFNGDAYNIFKGIWSIILNLDYKNGRSFLLLELLKGLRSLLDSRFLVNSTNYICIRHHLLLHAS